MGGKPRNTHSHPRRVLRSRFLEKTNRATNRPAHRPGHGKDVPRAAQLDQPRARVDLRGLPRVPDVHDVVLGAVADEDRPVVPRDLAPRVQRAGVADVARPQPHVPEHAKRLRHAIRVDSVPEHVAAARVVRDIQRRIIQDERADLGRLLRGRARFATSRARARSAAPRRKERRHQPALRGAGEDDAALSTYGCDRT